MVVLQSIKECRILQDAGRQANERRRSKMSSWTSKLTTPSLLYHLKIRSQNKYIIYVLVKIPSKVELFIVESRSWLLLSV